MDLWNARNSSWGCCHFVLTRAGFLHWFKSMDSTNPMEPALNLSKCVAAGCKVSGDLCRHHERLGSNTTAHAKECKDALLCGGATTMCSLCALFADVDVCMVRFLVSGVELCILPPCRCEFEAGQAPAFNLVEAGSGNWLMGRSGRKVTLKVCGCPFGLQAVKHARVSVTCH